MPLMFTKSKLMLLLPQLNWQMKLLSLLDRLSMMLLLLLINHLLIKFSTPKN